MEDTQKVRVPQAALLTGFSAPKIYADIKQNKIPHSLDRAGKIVVAIDDLEAEYGLVTESESDIIKNLENQIESLEDHISTLKGQLESENNRNDVLLRVLDPEINAPIDIFLAPYIEFFKH